MIKLKTILNETKKSTLNEDLSIPVQILIGMSPIVIPFVLNFLPDIARKSVGGASMLFAKAIASFSPKVKAELEKAKLAIEKRSDELDQVEYIKALELAEKMKDDPEIIKFSKELIANPYKPFKGYVSKKDREQRRLRDQTKLEMNNYIKSKYGTVSRQVLTFIKPILTGTDQK